MTITKQKVTPCLWFDTEAEEAAKLYCSVFKDSNLGKISRYTEAGRDSMRMGWTGTFEQLEAYLAKAK
jgi:predicted 3-demethylubiquinone-9 3-methyltransferase (glyoxalase superfamily)